MTDQELDKLFRLLAQKQGFGPLSDKEAQRAFDEAITIPLSQEEIDKIVDYATLPKMDGIK